MITDAQVHLYEAETTEHPWPHEPGRMSPPARYAVSFTPERMLGAMDAIGVDRAVIVPPVWWGEDNSPALAAATQHGGRFGVMGRLDPYASDAPARLERWLEQPGMLGLRMSGRWSSTPTTAIEALSDPSLEWYWEACERLGIPIMLLTQRHVSRLAPIAERHPGLTLIVDHLSTESAQTAAESFVALDDVLALARYPRIFVKVGTAPNCSHEAYPYPDVQPYLRRTFEAFGPQRLLWEADVTQLTKDTYADCLRLWAEGLPFLSDDDREWILGRAAAEALNWPVPS